MKASTLATIPQIILIVIFFIGGFNKFQSGMFFIASCIFYATAIICLAIERK